MMGLLCLVVLLLAGCKGSSEKTNEQTLEWQGNYVSIDYYKRNDGYDWIGVSVVQTDDEGITVSVRSRADKKKPTCTFDTNAKKVDDENYLAIVEGKAILFSRLDDKLTISTQEPGDIGLLSFYCSGGGTLAGEYTKIDEPLDQTQIDKSAFNKTYILQNITFNVSSVQKGTNQDLLVIPFGLSIENRSDTTEVDGIVTNAEIEDLNFDGFPEILVYIERSDGKGDVIGYSVNNGKSMSRVYFPPVEDDPKLSKGYAGHDEFTIVETYLSQRFPVYEDNQPTGKIRQIDYKLVDGEALRRFIVKNVNEYDSK